MRTPTLLAITATAATLTAAFAIGAQSASADGNRTIRAHENFTGTDVQAFGRTKPALGNILAFTSEVKDLKGRHLASSVGQCTVYAGTTDSDTKYNCYQTYHFPDGDFITGGLYDAGVKHTQWPLFAGTGRFHGVTGVFDFVTVTADSFDDTFHFNS